MVTGSTVPCPSAGMKTAWLLIVLPTPARSSPAAASSAAATVSPAVYPRIAVISCFMSAARRWRAVYPMERPVKAIGNKNPAACNPFASLANGPAHRSEPLYYPAVQPVAAYMGR
jgi:hypothetical protein